MHFFFLMNKSDPIDLVILGYLQNQMYLTYLAIAIQYYSTYYNIPIGQVGI